MKEARGQEYQAILRQILRDVGGEIAEDARQMKDETGSITLLNCGVLAVSYDLNLKAVMEWLEESRVLPTGTYELCQSRGMKAREVLAAARQKIGSEG